MLVRKLLIAEVVMIFVADFHRIGAVFELLVLIVDEICQIPSMLIRFSVSIFGGSGCDGRADKKRADGDKLKIHFGCWKKMG